MSGAPAPGREAAAVLAALFDPGSFTAVSDPAEGGPPGVLTGHGTVEGRAVCAVAQAPGGAPGAAAVEAEVRLRALAARTGKPLVTVHDATGPGSARGFGEVVRGAVALSGVVPQVAVVTGAADAERALLLPLADVVVAAEGSRSALADPAAAAVLTGRERDARQLGGAALHAAVTGRAAHVAPGPAAAAAFVRELLGHLPGNVLATPPRLPPGAVRVADEDPDEELDALLPADPDAPYDVRDVLARLADDEEPPLELHALHAAGVLTGFTRLDGRSLGVVAPDPSVAGGALDAPAAAKAARFVRFCDAFGVPVLTLVDTAGVVPAGEDDPGAPTVAVAQLLYAYAEASVPLLTVVTGRAHGAALLALGSRHVGADAVLVWPRARLGARDAVAEVAAGHGPAPAAGEWARLVARREAERSPAAAVRAGDADAVVGAGRTRAHLARWLDLLERKAVTPPARRHGNLPL
ncbi:carboxyl transferase domain-containing protein [Kineococcus sp. SYSU DK018]|uniref:carboxyl transferase domain-containing protein n=1 Tax=Kineococcus sp. SYSU DK018 TaxID=3383139 RepID=UPI003D7CBAD3